MTADSDGVRSEVSHPYGDATGAKEVVGSIDFMHRARQLEQTPSLVDADVADDVRQQPRHRKRWCRKPLTRHATERTRRIGALKIAVRLNTVGSSRPMLADTPLPNCAVYWMLFTPVTVVVAADQERRVVARITVPGRRVGRGRLTEGEPSELDEHVLNRDIAAAGAVEQRTTAVVARGRSTPSELRVDGVACRSVVELEVALTEGADNAVFGGGTGIDGQRHTRTGHVKLSR